MIIISVAVIRIFCAYGYAFLAFNLVQLLESNNDVNIFLDNFVIIYSNVTEYYYKSRTLNL